MQLPPPCGIVTLLTDFGPSDPYVGIMKGAVKRANLRADIVDLCHEVPPQDIEVAAFFVDATRGRFPPGTVHVAVVDPGVGGGRRCLAVCTDGCYWLLPDNGIGTPLWQDLDACEVLALDIERLGIRPRSNTFHGRDVFAPIAGHLSSGRYGFRALGGRVRDAIEIERSHAPRVVFVDHFGNLISNVRADVLEDGVTGLRVAGRIVPIVQTYSAAPRGSVVAVVNSYDQLEIAAVEGSAYELLGVGRGTPVELRMGEEA